LLTTPTPHHSLQSLIKMVASSFHHTKHFYRPLLPPRYNMRYDNASFIGAKVGKKKDTTAAGRANHAMDQVVKPQPQLTNNRLAPSR